MVDQQSATTNNSETVRRDIFIAAFLAIFICGASFLTNFLSVNSLNNPNLANLRWPYLAIIPVFLIVFLILNQGHNQRAAWVTLIGYGLIALPSSFVTQGIGLLTGAVMALIIWRVGVRILPEQQASYSIFLGVGTGILVFIIDILGPSSRTVVDIGTAVGYLIGFMVALTAGYLILRNYEAYRLQTKFITAITILAVASIAVTTIIVSQTTDRALTDEFGTDLQTIASSNADTIGEILAREVQLLQLLQKNPILVTHVEEANTQYSDLSDIELQARLTRLESQWLQDEGNAELIGQVIESPAAAELTTFQNAFPEHAAVFLTDINGALIASTKDIDQFAFAGEPWWQRAFQQGSGSIVIEDPRRDDFAKLNAIPITIPVYNDNEEVIGVLHSAFNLQNFLAPIARTSTTAENIQINIVVANQILEIGQNDIELNEIEFQNFSLIDFLQNDYLIDSYREESNFISISRIQTLTNIPAINQLDWFVMVAQPETEVASIVDNLRQVQILIGIFIVIVGALAAAIVGRWVSQPILDLANVAERVAGGDLQARASITTGDEIATLGNAFNFMAAEIQSSVATLETRVDERTRLLEVGSRISRSIAAIIDKNQLTEAVVTELQEAFNYYHVQLYLVNPNDNKLHLTSATGAAGRALLDRSHILNIGEGIVGRAAQNNEIVLAPDVAQSQDWKPNEMLPETKAELAIPISLGNEVIGVIDVQDNFAYRLSDRDADLITGIANQTAIAVRNADYYAEAQKRADRETQINAIRAKIQGTQSIESALKTAARELGQALESDNTVVRFNVPNSPDGAAVSKSRRQTGAFTNGRKSQ